MTKHQDAKPKPIGLSPSTESWDAYWQGDTSSSAYTNAAIGNTDISAWWAMVFEQQAKSAQQTNMLDIATGNGALPELATGIWPKGAIDITACDISPTAIQNTTQRLKSVNGVVADALNLPFEPSSFSLVCSQFGVEYAGIDAVERAALLVADHGFLVLMMHIDQGIIEQNCRASRDALTTLQECEFVSLAYTMFEQGFRAVAGEDRQGYDSAAELLAPALSDVEKIIEQYGVDIADGAILRLYNDIGKIHSKLPNYQADEVLSWLKKMQSELHSYMQRMETMLNAAVNQTQFKALSEKLIETGFILHDNAVLFDKQSQQPLAWILRAEKNHHEQ